MNLNHDPHGIYIFSICTVPACFLFFTKKFCLNKLDKANGQQNWTNHVQEPANNISVIWIAQWWRYPGCKFSFLLLLLLVCTMFSCIFLTYVVRKLYYTSLCFRNDNPRSPSNKPPPPSSPLSFPSIVTRPPHTCCQIDFTVKLISKSLN